MVKRINICYPGNKGMCVYTLGPRKDPHFRSKVHIRKKLGREVERV